MRLDWWNSPLFKIIVVALLFQQADTNFHGILVYQWEIGHVELRRGIYRHLWERSHDTSWQTEYSISVQGLAS